MSKCPKKVREKSKTRAWEKQRRNRLKEYFNKLWEALPIYDKSKPASKADILIHAASTIKDLDEKLKKLLVTPDTEKPSDEKLKVSSDVIKKLQDRVKKLLLRNEQLANLLSNAGIKVPSECGPVKKFKKTLKYTNAITTELQAKIVQKELEKENQVKGAKPRITKTRAKNITPFAKSKRKLKKQLLSLPNCLFVVSQPPVASNPCLILSKISAKAKHSAMTNSLLVKAPLVSSNIKPSIFPTIPPLSGLGPGTLMFADGTIMPVVPSPRPLPVLPTIITNPVPSQLSAVIVVSSKSNTNSTCADKITVGGTSRNVNTFQTFSNGLMKQPGKNNMSVLRPRSNITMTTQVNKVPIPALSSKYNKHACLNSKIGPVDSRQKKESNAPLETSSVNVTLAKKRTLEQAKDEAKRVKTTSDEVIPINLNTNENTDKAESGEKSVQIHQEKSDCTITSTANTSLILQSSISGKKSEQSREKVLDNQAANSIQVLPIDSFPFADNGNRNLGKSSFISDAPAIKTLSETVTTSEAGSKHAKLGVEVDKESFESSNELETFTNISSKAESMKKANSPPARGVSKQLDVSLSRSEKSCISTEDKVSIDTSKCSNAINSKPLEMHMQHKSCAKPLELVNVQTNVIAQTSNLNDLKSLEINLSQAELSNDIFASFQVPPGCQNPESTSPTAAFLLAFPLVSSGVKVAEVMGDENSESQTGTPNLLQIGTMDISKPTQSYSESLTPNLLSFENFSFFNNKDGFYNNFGTINTSCQSNSTSIVTSSSKPISSFSNNTLNDNGVKKSASELKFPQFQYSKTENVNNKAANKIDMNVKDGKFPIYNNMGSCASQVAKAQNIEKPVLSSAGQINANVLDINSDMFSFKPVSNDYLSNDKNSNSGTVVGSMYASKPSSSMPGYSNYKNCNASVNNNFVENKHYPAVYTSAGIGNTFYNAFGAEGDGRNFSTSNYNNYTDYNRKGFTNSCSANAQIYQKEKNAQAKVKPPVSKPINWMTTPSTTSASAPYKSDYFLPPFSREPSFNSNLVPNTSFSTLPSNTYFNSSVYNPNDHLNINQDFRKTSDMSLTTYTSYQRAEAEENQFSWSPNKMPQFLDTTHAHSFVSSTLPTLVGDLALNNTPVAEPKNLKDKNRDNRRKNCEGQGGQSSFLSVSQLVEPSQENVPAKVASRRSSGNRSKTNTPKIKRGSGRPEVNKEMQNYQKAAASNLFNDNKQQQSRNNSKHIASSYSAEALIGNQASSESAIKRNNLCQNKAVVPSFFNENVISYFPSAEASQETGYVHTNQSYHQSNSFSQNFPTTFQNNSYGSSNYIPSSCTITSSYIPANNFMPNSNAQDFLGDNTNPFQNNNAAVAKEKCNFTKTYYRPEKVDKNQSYSCKKAKKRATNDNVLPSFDLHFFSMPGAVNSPVLPDDFHTTYLPPTTLYSCKNPLYSKPNSDSMPSSLIPPLPAISGPKPTIQHPQMSPSVNSAGTSLTNFNLSTIFPEMNKGPVQETFSNNRNRL